MKRTIFTVAVASVLMLSLISCNTIRIDIRKPGEEASGAQTEENNAQTEENDAQAEESSPGTLIALPYVDYEALTIDGKPTLRSLGEKTAKAARVELPKGAVLTDDPYSNRWGPYYVSDAFSVEFCGFYDVPFADFLPYFESSWISGDAYDGFMKGAMTTGVLPLADEPGFRHYYIIYADWNGGLLYLHVEEDREDDEPTVTENALDFIDSLLESLHFTDETLPEPEQQLLPAPEPLAVSGEKVVKLETPADFDFYEAIATEKTVVFFRQAMDNDFYQSFMGNWQVEAYDIKTGEKLYETKPTYDGEFLRWELCDDVPGYDLRLFFADSVIYLDSTDPGKLYQEARPGEVSQSYDRAKDSFVYSYDRGKDGFVYTDDTGLWFLPENGSAQLIAASEEISFEGDNVHYLSFDHFSFLEPRFCLDGSAVFVRILVEGIDQGYAVFSIENGECLSMGACVEPHYYTLFDDKVFLYSGSYPIRYYDLSGGETEFFRTRTFFGKDGTCLVIDDGDPGMEEHYHAMRTCVCTLSDISDHEQIKGQLFDLSEIFERGRPLWETVAEIEDLGNGYVLFHRSGYRPAVGCFS